MTPPDTIPTKREVGIVINASRRFVEILDGVVLEGTVSSKALHVATGDKVVYERERGGGVVVKEVLPRKNEFCRTVSGKAKELGVNLDRIFIVSAVGEVFNPVFIDRTLVTAAARDIPATILLNKLDRGTETVDDAAKLYAFLGWPFQFVSAKTGAGLDALRKMLSDPSLEVVALTGVSGVGKSSLLKALIPGLELKVGEVSKKTGQGKQTTTQPTAFPYTEGRTKPLLCIDLPGVQNFGIGHLTKDAVLHGFPELIARYGKCDFDDCSHIHEESCAIKDAVEAGQVSESRYNSFVGMMLELDEVKKY